MTTDEIRTFWLFSNLLRRLRLRKRATAALKKMIRNRLGLCPINRLNIGRMLRCGTRISSFCVAGRHELRSARLKQTSDILIMILRVTNNVFRHCQRRTLSSLIFVGKHRMRMTIASVRSAKIHLPWPLRPAPRSHLPMPARGAPGQCLRSSRLRATSLFAFGWDGVARSA